MPAKRLGRQTVRLSNPVSVVSYASIGGKLEAQGPLAGYFDELSTDSFFGCKTWEKGEAAMQRRALERALLCRRRRLSPEDPVDYILAGDLLQPVHPGRPSACASSRPVLRALRHVLHDGRGLSLASLLIDGGFARLAAQTSSARTTAAERQYHHASLWQPACPDRPSGRPPQQAASRCAGRRAVYHVTCGKIVDLGISDVSNMGHGARRA